MAVATDENVSSMMVPGRLSEGGVTSEHGTRVTPQIGVVTQLQLQVGQQCMH
jgi:hypothetical protein